jgi:transcriptional regulator with XRE-family HTH domain
VNPLQELIRTRMTERHWSFADVARRGGLPHSTVHHLATNERPTRPPHPQTLSRLAAGLGLPDEQVRAAAAQAVGYTVLSAATQDPAVELLVAALGKLDKKDLRHVAALVRSLLDEDETAGDAFADAFEQASGDGLTDGEADAGDGPE